MAKAIPIHVPITALTGSSAIARFAQPQRQPRPLPQPLRSAWHAFHALRALAARPFRGVAWRGGAWAAVWSLLIVAPRTFGAEAKQWSVTPYRGLVEIVVDVSTPGYEGLADRLRQTLHERADAGLHPTWELTIEEAAADRQAHCRQMEPVPFESLPQRAQTADKFVQFYLSSDPLGFDAQAREFDGYLRRWGPPHRDRIVQRSALEEACFALLTRALSPLARIEVDPDDPDRVRLQFKAHEIPRRTDEPPIARETILAPMLRRTTRTGQLHSKGVNPVPWTLIVADAHDEQGWSGRVHSGLRRPFAARRQGMVEAIAMVVRPTGLPTRVRFYPRKDRQQGLPGYEVFLQAKGAAARLLGITDATGAIDVPVGDAPVVDLLLRSDGALLAKAPVAPGVEALVEAPIADDRARLEAHAEVRALREELIDLVAHRSILAGRIRAKLAAGQLAAAKDLMESMNQLPLQSAFERRIESAQRSHHSDDPKVQERIDQVFADTRQILNRFLNVRDITDLQTEVNSASPLPNEK